MERRKPSTANKSQTEKVTMNPKDPMTKIQKQVTAWLKDNVPTKRTKFLYSHVVDYFSGKKAVDMLMEESPWAPPTEDNSTNKNPSFMFETREQCVEFLDMLLRYKMFHRAKKVPVTEENNGKRGKKKDKSDSDDGGCASGGVTGSQNNQPVEQGSGDMTEANENLEEKQELISDDKKQQKKRKIRLDMHLDQIFVDAGDAYVWLYDPIPWYYWIAGGLIVITIIILCLFPLWPRKLRRGTHWMIWLASCFMVGVMCVGVLKYILYWALYLLSGFKLKFHIFPNLTEDTTFLQSFWPLYAYKYTGEIKSDPETNYNDNSSTSRPEEEQEVMINQKMEKRSDESDSNESGKSFEFVEKSKDI